jgi:plastocyanin
MKTLVLALLLALGLVILACGDESTPTTTNATPSGSGATAIDVEVRNGSFAPETTTLQPGQSVEFTATNTGSVTHTFTVARDNSKQQILVDLSLNAGESESQEMTVPSGVTSLYYFCRPHESQGMSGSFSVGTPTSGASSETKTPTVGSSSSDY